MSTNKINHFRNFIFGVEDSLVSTVGLLSGVAIAGTPRQTIILSGIVLIFVEAFSMGVGSFLSDHSAEELATKKETTGKSQVKSSVTMFLSYFFAGFIPLLPYLFLEGMAAFYFSILSSLIALFLLGAYVARSYNGKWLRKSLEMLVLGGIAIGLGVTVGYIVSHI